MEWKGIKGSILEDVPMKRYTSMRVGGQAKYLVYPQDEADMTAILRLLREEGMDHRILGNGTNIIVSDEGLKETLIRITKMRYLKFAKTKTGAAVKVSGGMPLKKLIRECADRGLAGLEKLYWIPGTVGGGIKMNAGSFGQSISDTLEEVTVADRSGRSVRWERKDLDFGYRKSPIGPDDCVLSARFVLTERDKKEISADMDYVCNERKRRHPMEYPSAGSVFRGVNGEPAWKFIEAAGLKGLTIGGACVSEKHANFIINLGSARAKDIKNLMERIKTEVYEKLGVTLVEEVELWGFHG